MRARHACLSRRAPRFILAGALGSPRARAAFLTVSDKPTRDASRARGRASGPRRYPCSRTLLPKHPRVCVQERRTRGVGTIACQEVLEGAKPRGRLGEHPLLRDDGLGRAPAAGPSARGGQTLPRPAGGQLYEQQQGRRLPPTPADPGALPLPEGGGTLGRPLRCPPRARGSTGGSGLAARRLPLAPAPAIRCLARRPGKNASGQKQLLRKTRPCREEEAGEQAAGTRGASA